MGCRMANEELVQNITNSVAASATNAAGYQVTRLVDLGVNGFLNILLGQSKEDKMREMGEHHDHLIEIVNKNKASAPRELPRLSPRESVERDIRESNEHINAAIVELERAREKSKCGVCKNTLGETIDLVSEKTGEILDVSEKVLALQRLKETGEISPTLSWYDLNRKQKKLVEETVKMYRPIETPQESAIGNVNNSRIISVRRVDDGKTKRHPPKTPRKAAGRKRKE